MLQIIFVTMFGDDSLAGMENRLDYYAHAPHNICHDH
jgi:hypothetical protein